MSRAIQFKNNVIDFIQAHYGKILFFTILILLAQGSFASNALADADPVITETYNGSLKKYLYIGEGVAAVVALMFTRSIKHLGALFGVAMFLNILAALADI